MNDDIDSKEEYDIDPDEEPCPVCGTDLEFEMVPEMDGWRNKVQMKNYWYCPDCDQHYEKVSEDEDEGGEAVA